MLAMRWLELVRGLKTFHRRSQSNALVVVAGFGCGAVDLGPGEERQEIVAEVTIFESPSDASKLIAATEHLDVAAAWTGEPGRSFLSGIAVVSDASSSDVAWIPSELLGDAAVGEALAAHSSVRGHNVKELMRSLLGLDIEMRGLSLDTAIAAWADPTMTKRLTGIGFLPASPSQEF